MRGFIRFCFGCLLGGFLLGVVGLAFATPYVWTSSCVAGSYSFPTQLADLVCQTPACTSTTSWHRGVSNFVSATQYTFECVKDSNGFILNRNIYRSGTECPPDTIYKGDPWFGCVGVQPVPPAESGDPCISGGGAPGDSSARVDPANCSVYAYSGPAPSSCLVDGNWGPCPCWDGRCNNIYCPTGEEKQDCVPSGTVPDAPDSPPYLPDPEQTVPDEECTAASGCSGSPPASPPPPDSGEPDPADPDGGSHGDVPQQSESTSTTGADGSSTTTDRETTWNPYSQETVVRETTTRINPDGSTVQEKTTSTSKGTAGGGTSRTTTKVTTRTAADGTVTTETEGSSETTDKEAEKAPESSASGGVDCAAEPVCKGDAIQCGILKQIWRDNCVFSKVSGGDSCDAPPVCDQSQLACGAALQAWHDRCPQGSPDSSLIAAAVDAVVPASEMTLAELDAAVASDPDYSPDAEVDLSSISIGPTNPSPSGSCPLPFSITVMGVDVAIGSTELCDFTDWISWLVRISASLFALFIITGYGVGRSTGGA